MTAAPRILCLCAVALGCGRGAAITRSADGGGDAMPASGADAAGTPEVSDAPPTADALPHPTFVRPTRRKAASACVPASRPPWCPGPAGPQRIADPPVPSCAGSGTMIGVRRLALCRRDPSPVRTNAPPTRTARCARGAHATRTQRRARNATVTSVATRHRPACRTAATWASAAAPTGRASPSRAIKAAPAIRPSPAIRPRPRPIGADAHPFLATAGTRARWARAATWPRPGRTHTAVRRPLATRATPVRPDPGARWGQRAPTHTGAS